jgi:hypothetical protein
VLDGLPAASTLSLMSRESFDLAQGSRSTEGAWLEQGRQQWRKSMMRMNFGKLAIATSTAACAVLFSFSWSEQRGVSLSVESAQARVGRPLTPMSVAGVARRQHRRAAYGYGAGVVGAGLAAGYGYYGGSPYVGTGRGNYGGYGTSGYRGTYGAYPAGYYGGYAHRSYVTGRPTLFPRYYGGYGTSGYRGSYAAYPAGYYGGYANRSYVTGRPTLFPRYYGGWGW